MSLPPSVQHDHGQGRQAHLPGRGGLLGDVTLAQGLAAAAFDAMEIGIYCVDPEGACLLINRAGLELLGYDSAEELLGRTMHELIHHTRADGSPYPPEECPLLNAARSGASVRLENEMLWRKDGSFFVAEYSSSPIRRNGQVIGGVVSFRDQADRRNVEARLAVQYAVGRVMAGDAGLEEALPRILQAIGTGLGWNMGVLWLAQPEESVLAPAATWRAPGVEAPAIEQQTAGLRFPSGEGMPGRVWASGQVELVSDLRAEATIPRRAAASADGFRSAIGMPVKVGAHTLGVLEFLDRETIRLDEDLRITLTSLGQQIGQFIRRRHAERALREREEQYRFMADSIPQLVWTARPDGALDYVNARWAEYCGLPTEEALGSRWEAVIHPDDLPAMAAAWEAARASGTTYTAEARIRGRSGQYRWFLNRAVPLRDSHGRVLRWFGSSTDVEDAKRAERDIRLNEQRFRSLVEATSAIVWTTPPSGEFIEPQPSWAAFTGQNEAAYRGRGWIDAVHPDDRSRTMLAWDRALEQRAMYEVEHRVRRHDGQWRFMAARAVPILASDGSVREWVGLHSDVTETRRTERALLESRERLRAALLASRTGTFRWDIPNDVFEMDEGFLRLLGLPSDRYSYPIEEAVSRFVHPEDRDAVSAEVARVVAEGGEVAMEYRIIRVEDQAVRWLSTKGEATHGPDGRPLHMIGAVVDITERRQFEEELVSAKEAAEEANRAKSQFLANMSHELRTPLSAVIGYSELMEEEVEDLGTEGTEELLEDIRKIRSNARHLLDLINDVLDLSKVEAGKMEVQPEDFDADALLSDVAATVQGLVEKKSNKLTLDIAPGGLGTMHSDPVKLRQCLFNLLSNAAKFTENGEITLSARHLPPGQGGTEDQMHCLEFRVRDTGIGMTKAQLAKLFQRFSQADSSTTRRFGGTGLGLALTKAFCHLLGGQIEVESRAGRGSIFTIRVPADLRPVRSGTEPVEEAEEGEDVASLMLVIDDDPPTRDLLSRFLQREGFAVRTASDGEEGLRLAAALKPRAILLDVMMPRVDGWAVLSALKSDHELAGIPVIMISVVQEKGLAFSLGAADYLTKPVDWRRLKRAVEPFRSTELGLALVVEHDGATREELRRLLEDEGWSVAEAASGEEALRRMGEAVPRVVLLDLQAPEPGGITFLRNMRRNPDWQAIPVVAIAEGEMSPAERERLRGQVQQIIQTGGGVPEELVAELKRIAAGRPAQSHEATEEGKSG